MPRDLAKTLIYHITDIENLPSILSDGGLVSDMTLARRRGGPSVVIGHDHIKRRRMTQTRIPHADNRFVGDFVPFYYCPRSPMLFTVNMGNTGRDQGCQRSIVHLVSSVAEAIALAQPWAISDVNAGSGYPQFFDDVGALDAALDWTAIRATFWSDCATKKAAEFLVQDCFPWTSILAIGCHNDAAAGRVDKLLASAPHKPRVLVRKDWYYSKP